MAKKAFFISNLMLRLFALIFLLVSIVILATDKVTVPDFFSDDDDSVDTKVTFKNAISYKYALAVGIIGLVYTLLAIPVAAFQVVKYRRTVRRDLTLKIHLVTDMVIILLLATGAGAAFGLAVDLKKKIDDAKKTIDFSSFFIFASEMDKFLNRVYISATFLVAAAVCTAAVVIVVTHALARK